MKQKLLAFLKAFPRAPEMIGLLFSCWSPSELNPKEESDTGREGSGGLLCKGS